jgi:hypothetical protein
MSDKMNKKKQSSRDVADRQGWAAAFNTYEADKRAGEPVQGPFIHDDLPYGGCTHPQHARLAARPYRPFEVCGICGREFDGAPGD